MCLLGVMKSIFTFPDLVPVRESWWNHPNEFNLEADFADICQREAEI